MLAVLARLLATVTADVACARQRTGRSVQRQRRGAKAASPLSRHLIEPPLGIAMQMTTVTLNRKDAPRAARRLVAEGCASAATGTQCADSAALMTSEVVTNAVTHSTGDITFGFLADSLLVRVEVGDGDPRRPRIRNASNDDEGGRGMLIVQALSFDWGVQDRPPGKVVWFEVPRQP